MSELEPALDAVLRFAAGQDLGDRELYESAFAADAVLDFRHPAARFGAEVPLMEGRDVIMEIAFPATRHLVTTHVVTNGRFTPTEDGDRGRVHALVAATHVDPERPERRLLLQNHYFVDVVRDTPGWRIAHLVIENAWSTGDAEVLFGAAAA
ncbi:hypothetical protein DSM104299_04128 [Baekduia alba]|uniref:nuclear transport factor 2 family protein n=1 Tax=Baekduia alba TaxID=2997333 RepID=UPI00233FD5A6|nr:nuclear transport factor 2 family protein [Baekduia alba]WCB95385.1 hypothetical protein DSM104299_04128 [Baekduia alba]